MHAVLGLPHNAMHSPSYHHTHGCTADTPMMTQYGSCLHQQFVFKITYLIVTRFAKTRHNDAFLEIQNFCISEFYIPKALFCSNSNAVLQILFELQG